MTFTQALGAMLLLAASIGAAQATATTLAPRDINDDGLVWYYDTRTDRYDFTSQTTPMFAWAVHTGDVMPAVPEPTSIALTGVGCLLVALVRRRHAKPNR